MRRFVVSVSLALGVLGGTAPAFAVSDEAIAAKRPPAMLSQFGFFDDLPALQPAEGVLPFAPSSALFSDGALKDRFVYVPAGKAARHVEDATLDFPEGSALIKTFSFPAARGQPGGGVRIIETRVLLKQADGWHGWAYVWNDEQTDAKLNIAGARIEVETVNAHGEPLGFTYSVPNKNQCKGCHDIGGAMVPLGPKARNLNHDFAYADGTANQLRRWQEEGLVEGVPDLASVEAVPDWRDETAGVDARARAWLDANCAHCHRRDGPASNSGLYLTWEEPYGPALGINKRPVAAGRGSGGRLFDIRPGDPDGSILNYRVESTEPGVMMPELGRTLADPEASELLRKWVAGLERN